MSIPHRTAIAVLLAFAGSAAADDRAELAAAFGKAFARGSFRFEMQTSSAGKPFATVTDVQLPDRFRMKTPDAEFIIVPQGTWMNVGGQWMKAPMDMSRSIQGFSQKAIDDGLAALSDVRRVGSEEIRGCSSTLYRYRTSGNFLGVAEEAEVAICESSGLPVRVVSGGEQPVTVHYDFEAAIDIQPPR